MKTQKKILILILLVVIIRGLHYSLNYYFGLIPKYPINFLNTISPLLLYAAVTYLLVFWIYSLFRISNLKIRRILSAEMTLLHLWLGMRILRFSPFLFDDSLLGIYLWYGYYIGLILIPALNLICALLLGTHEKQSLHRYSVPILTLGILLLAMVLSNNFHQLVFKFNLGFLSSVFGNYTHMPLYYIITAYIFICELAFLIIVEIKALSAGKRSYLPFGILGVAVLYVIFYFRFESFFLFKILDLTLAYIFFHVLLWESIFMAGLIPTNRDYVKMFSMSTIYAKIIDKNGNLIYQSASTPPENLKGFSEKNAEISGGYVEYYYDNRELYSLLEKLQNLKTELSESINILDEEVKIKKKREKLLLQDELFNTINKNNSFANNRIYSLLKMAAEGDLAEKEKALLKILIWGSYIKRYTNLYFIKENKKGPTFADLTISFDEVLSYLELNDIDASFDVIDKDAWEAASPETLLRVFYDFFDRLSSNEDIIAISLLLTKKDGKPIYRINFEEAAS